MADTSEELTGEVLRDIRESIRALDTRLSKRIDDMETRFDGRLAGVEARFDDVDARFERLEGPITDSEIRTGTAILSLKGSIDDIKHLLLTRLDLGDRVTRCEHEIEVIKSRLPG